MGVFSVVAKTHFVDKLVQQCAACFPVCASKYFRKRLVETVLSSSLTVFFPRFYNVLFESVFS
jgi:hypothetical protein